MHRGMCRECSQARGAGDGQHLGLARKSLWRRHQRGAGLPPRGVWNAGPWHIATEGSALLFLKPAVGPFPPAR